MITEKLLKDPKKAQLVTGKIEAKLADRSDFRGLASTKKTVSQYSWVLSFEIKDGYWLDLLTTRHELRQFAQPMSVIKFLKSLDLRDGFEITFNYRTAKD